MWCRRISLLLDSSWTQLECRTEFVFFLPPFHGRCTNALCFFYLVLILVSYAITVILCMVLEAPLIDNPNRPGKLIICQSSSDKRINISLGFIALAQFPVVFLFATKNSLVSLVLGPGNGYEKLNFIHRWSGRVMFLGAVLHGSLWIRNHIQYDMPIFGQQKETSGVAALGVLSIIVISSIKPIRRFCYEIFFTIQ